MSKTTVGYLSCEIAQSMKLTCIGGPFDGEQRVVTPDEYFGNTDLIAVWDQHDERCEAYETVIRFTLRKGDEGAVLKWVPT